MITSPHNDNLTQVRKLAGRKWRDKLGEFVAEGEDLIAAAVNDAVNAAPARTVGWSPVTSALVGAVIGSRQQKSRASGANTWTKG